MLVHGTPWVRYPPSAPLNLLIGNTSIKIFTVMPFYSQILICYAGKLPYVIAIEPYDCVSCSFIYSLMAFSSSSLTFLAEPV